MRWLMRVLMRFRPEVLDRYGGSGGGSVILFDQFSGTGDIVYLGEVASLLLSRMAVPIIYYIWMKHAPEKCRTVSGIRLSQLHICGIGSFAEDSDSRLHLFPASR